MIFISKASSSKDGQKHSSFSIYDFNTGGRIWGIPGYPHYPLLHLASQAGHSPSGGVPYQHPASWTSFSDKLESGYRRHRLGRREGAFLMNIYPRNNI